MCIRDRYIAETQDRSRAETTKAGDFVEEHLVIVQQEFDKALADIADLQQEQQIIDLESEVRSAVARLSELLMAAEENAARIREVRAQIGELRGIQGEENIDLISPATVAANPDIRALRETIMALRLQREATLQDKTDRHPDVLRIDAQLRASGEALGLMMEEQHTLDPSVLKLRTELAGLLERGVEINDAIARTTETFSLYPDKMRQLSQLTLAASAAEEVYKALQAQSYEIAIAEALSAAPLQLVELAPGWAGEPLDPESPAAAFERSGGHDLSQPAGLAAALALHTTLGPAAILARCRTLTAWFAAELHARLAARRVVHTFFDPPTGASILTPPAADRLYGALHVQFPDLDPYPAYIALDARGIHVKCIKGPRPGGAHLNLLRFCLPAHESFSRLTLALDRVAAALAGAPC